MTDLLTRALVPAPSRTPTAPAPEEAADAPASGLADCVAHDLVLAVAPTTGRFRPSSTAGARLRAGELVGHVTGGCERADAVLAPVDAMVVDLLVRSGQLVRRGQGLAWLRREGSSA